MEIKILDFGEPNSINVKSYIYRHKTTKLFLCRREEFKTEHSQFELDTVVILEDLEVQYNKIKERLEKQGVKIKAYADYH